MNINDDQISYYEKQHSYMDAVDSNYVNLLVNHIIEHCQLKKSDRILEIGCGSGRFSIPLLKKGFSLTCIDPSQNLLSKFKAHATKEMNAEILNISISEIPKAYKGAFDKAIGFYILHHLSNVADDLIQLRQYLKGQGQIAFIEPNPYNLMFYVQISVTKDLQWKYEKGMLKMRKSFLEKTLSSHGYEKIEFRNFGLLPPFAMNTRFGFTIENFTKNLWVPLRPYQFISAQKKHYA